MTSPEPDTPDIQPAPPIEASPEVSDSSLTTADAPEPPRRRRRPFIRFLRILAFLVVIAGLAVGAYYGWPVVYDRYIRPVETNAAELTTLEQQLEQANDRISRLEAEAAAIRADLDGVAGDDAETTRRFDDVTAAIDRHTERLDTLDDLTADLTAGADQLSATMERELDLLRSMELLSRARLFLYQANYGLAAADLTAARSLLAATDPDGDTPEIVDTIFRLDLALGALPDRPVAASDDLDIAWQTLLGQLPQPATPPSAPPTTTEPPATTEAPTTTTVTTAP